MAKDHIGYDDLVDNALRGAMREVMLRVAENGLLGSHHLYITFRTGYPGVDIPDHLRDRYPDELTIILQHQYWGLEVTEHGFSVTLSFNKSHEHVSVPFAALTRFADPGVKFDMQFEFKSTGGRGKLQLVGGADEVLAEAEEDGSIAEGMTEIGANRDAAGESSPAVVAAEADDAGLAETAEDGSGDTENSDETAQDESESNNSGAEVVTLDSFRKK
ncbi:MAG: ClpXP protease specificity-enhancing factor SspB [Proteobacteria bacterium]|nr:ClpXP protease specificity-enhancing factor SspB [Pseudomonadota bacterium]MDA1357945.1 ClpXP protease specificity-enhancing factor SspB [Pseudomonadota bacterium]